MPVNRTSPHPDPCLACIAHASPERTRLRFPDRRGDVEFFETLCDRIMRLTGVRSVEGRTDTGSLIIEHDAPSEDVLQAAVTAGLFTIGEAAPIEPPDMNIGAWKKTLDQTVASTFGGGIDLKMLTALAFILMAVQQLARGNVAPPAATALWYGLTLLFLNRPGGDPGPGNGGE